MALEFAILALLTRGPLHGHALGKQLDRLLHGLRAVNAGQVYATLARLASEGAVAPVARTGRAATTGVRTYALLPAGQRMLRRWLERPLGGAARPEPFVQQLAVLVACDDRHGIARALGERHRRCTSLRALLDRSRPPTPDPAHRLLVEAAFRHLDAELAWLAHARASLLGDGPEAQDGRACARDDMDSRPD
jgi:DNA-binding PadR family transcriptional regulator